MERADDQVAVICQIETAEALANLDEICATPGVDAVYIGPTDMAFGLGLWPKGGNRWWGSMFTEPEHIAAVKLVRAKAKEHGVAAVMHVLNNTEMAQQYLLDGFDGVMVGAARSWMLAGAGGALRSLRQSCAPVVPPKVTADDDVLEALASGKITVDQAKKAMAKL